MSALAQRIATYEDLLAVPENLVAEIIGGVLYTLPRPAGRHGRAQSDLGVILGGPFRLGRGGPGGWWFLDEPELHLLGDIVVPDLAGWRRDRLRSPGDHTHFSIAPDWVCEILSPRTERIDRLTKMDLYARAGVGHAWLIDPRQRTLEVYRLTPDGLWLRIGTWADAEQPHAEPFDAIALELGELWDLTDLPDDPQTTGR